jgi:hypothetical protein
MTFSELIYNIKDIYYYSEFCATHMHFTTGCSRFIGFCYLLVTFIGSIIWFKVAFSLWREHQQYKAYIQRLQEREKIADPETMAKYVWNGEF